VTADVIRRVFEHRSDVVPGFTKRHSVHLLVWFERHECMDSAIAREKSLKEWKRAWKLRMIESFNPQWRDLYPDIL